MKTRIQNYNQLCLTFILIAFYLTFPNETFSQETINGTARLTFKPGGVINQTAIWVEKDNGEYLETIFLTNFIGRRGGGNNTNSSDIDGNPGNRLSALPIWAHKRGVIDTTFGIPNFYPPAASKPSYPADIDAVTGATPGKTTQNLIWEFSDQPSGEYTFWIEVNTSFDNNPYHDYSWYRGQPSLVWRTKLILAENADSSEVFDYFGYGSVDGSNGNITPPDSTIISAANLLDDLGGYKFRAVFTPIPVNTEVDLSQSKTINSFHLTQNYPNPFNPSTTIEFTLPRASHVSLKIYNLTGQEIANLMNETRPAGIHRVKWEASNCPSGIYFAKLQAESECKVRKLNLLK